jgi:hypothetical protein
MGRWRRGRGGYIGRLRTLSSIHFTSHSANLLQPVTTLLLDSRHWTQRTCSAGGHCSASDPWLKGQPIRHSEMVSNALCKAAAVYCDWLIKQRGICNRQLSHAFCINARKFRLHLNDIYFKVDHLELSQCNCFTRLKWLFTTECRCLEVVLRSNTKEVCPSALGTPSSAQNVSNACRVQFYHLRISNVLRMNSIIWFG